MDVFDLRNRLVEDYARYTRCFIKIADRRVKAKVDAPWMTARCGPNRSSS